MGIVLRESIATGDGASCKNGQNQNYNKQTGGRLKISLLKVERFSKYREKSGVGQLINCHSLYLWLLDRSDMV